jgi:hypothetical protein
MDRTTKARLLGQESLDRITVAGQSGHVGWKGQLDHVSLDKTKRR